MCRLPQCILLAASIVVAGTSQLLGEQACRPHLTLKEVRFSEVREQRRTWTAVLDADAASCTAAAGRFDIRFIRLKETAPDLEFTEPLIWHAGRTEVAVDFWMDEAVRDYAIGDVAPCTCRN